MGQVPGPAHRPPSPLPPALHACCCRRSAHFQCPSPGSTSVPGEGQRGGGLREGARSLRWTAAPAIRRWVGRGGGFANLLPAGIKVGLPPSLGMGGALGRICPFSSLASSPGLGLRCPFSSAGDVSFPLLSMRSRCRVVNCICFYNP